MSVDEPTAWPVEEDDAPIPDPGEGEPTPDCADPDDPANS